MRSEDLNGDEGYNVGSIRGSHHDSYSPMLATSPPHCFRRCIFSGSKASGKR